MSHNYLNYEQKFITAVDEFDFLERVKPSAILQYFQDLATVHATKLNIGFEEMKEQNLCWILSRVSARIDRYPTLGEEICVQTFPRKPGLVEAIRDYYITNQKGESLIRGTSKWCVIDFKNRAIRRCSPLFSFKDSEYIPQNAVENGNNKIDEILSLTQEPQKALEGEVRITDLDRNRHMNNARYGDIVLNACDADFLASHSIKAFDINFLSELKMGDSYQVFKHTDPLFSRFEALNNKNGKVVFRAEVEWQKDESSI